MLYEVITLHQGIQFQVEMLDWDEKKAFVREVEVDYFTDANLAVQLKVLEIDKERSEAACQLGYGDVSVQAMATIFKKLNLKLTKISDQDQLTYRRKNCIQAQPGSPYRRI